MGRRARRRARRAAAFNAAIAAGVPAHIAGQAANRPNLSRALKASTSVTRAAQSGNTNAASLKNISTSKRPGKVATRTINKDTAIKGAIASGVDPGVAGSLGLVKKIPNVQKKAKAATAVAQAGGDASAQARAASNKRPVQTAQKIIKDTPAPAAAPAPKPASRPQQTLYDRTPRKVDDGENLKVKKKSKRKRRALSRGTAQLRIAPSGQSSNVPGKGGSGVNV